MEVEVDDAEDVCSGGGCGCSPTGVVERCRFCGSFACRGGIINNLPVAGLMGVAGGGVSSGGFGRKAGTTVGGRDGGAGCDGCLDFSVGVDGGKVVNGGGNCAVGSALECVLDEVDVEACPNHSAGDCGPAGVDGGFGGGDCGGLGTGGTVGGGAIGGAGQDGGAVAGFAGGFGGGVGSVGAGCDGGGFTGNGCDGGGFVGNGCDGGGFAGNGGIGGALPSASSFCRNSMHLASFEEG